MLNTGARSLNFGFLLVLPNYVSLDLRSNY